MGRGWVWRLVACVVVVAGRASAAPAWMDVSKSVDQRADALLAAMTPAEKRALLVGHFAVNLPQFGFPMPAGAVGSAGFVPGVARLGIPALQESDASLGITNPFNVRKGDMAVALPAGLATAASFDPGVAYANGALLGREAAARGLNVVLGPGLNLTREPRGGRNFEYFGEDPLLAGVLAGEMARGIADQHVMAVAKHFAVNDQESGREILNVTMAPQAMRESDLLAFEIALERGRPGAVMCAYNKVNGPWACGNDFLLNRVLKHDWGFPGFVMSDWGAVHAAADLTAGLDQESAVELDARPFLLAPLDVVLADGGVKQARVDDAARRVVRSILAAGLMDAPAKPAVDVKQDVAVARAAEAGGIVLLRNEQGTLPLTSKPRCVVVAGGDSDAGVPAGGGSSQVSPVGGAAREIALGGEGVEGMFRHALYDPPSPLAQIRARMPGVSVTWVDGRYPQEAAVRARFCPVAVVFVQQWSGEASDIADLSLPSGQDALVDAVTRANPHTVVVLQTAGPVLMPWLSQAGAVVEAWYGGSGGADAIASVLFGEVNPSGRLPMSFPAGMLDIPNLTLNGQYLPAGQAFPVVYREGADVGYRWYAGAGKVPLFPFGFGLSYTKFAYSGLKVMGGKTVSATFDVRNVGSVAGADVPQLYLTARRGMKVLRLLGWHKQALQPGESAHVTVTADARLLADFIPLVNRWHVPGGIVSVAVGANAMDHGLAGEAVIDEGMLAP
jgi:beta-glucosidase